MFITEADPAHIANIWQRVRAMFVRASDIVGALPALAVLAALTRARRREIASCIAVVEAIVRKLIFIEAAGIRRAESAAQASRPPHLEVVTRPSPSWSAALRAACAAGAARSNLQPFDPAQPETWRVCFKLAPPRDPQAREESRAPRVRALWGSSPPLPPPRPPQPPRQVTPAPLRLALALLVAPLFLNSS